MIIFAVGLCRPFFLDGGLLRCITPRNDKHKLVTKTMSLRADFIGVAIRNIFLATINML